MIQEDYVSFETAKRLKGKGFSGEYKWWYIDDGKYITNDLRDIYDYAKNHIEFSHLHNTKVPRPTLQMAMKWLRETHNIHIVLSPNKKMNNQYGSIIFVDKGGELHPQPTDFFHGTYEQACEAAITYCLTKLL